MLPSAPPGELARRPGAVAALETPTRHGALVRLRMLLVLAACAFAVGAHWLAEISTLEDELAVEALNGARGSAAANDCLESRIQKIPAGSTLRIETDSQLWYQRSAEAAFPRLEVVGLDAPADYVVTISTPATAPFCPGLDVTLRRDG